MHYAGSMRGTMIHFLVVTWKLVFIVFCFHVLLIILSSVGSFVWRVEYELEMPIGSMILPTLHDACFRGSNGQPMITKLHIFSSCGRSHLKNLSFWRRHFVIYLFDGVDWATLGGHKISAQYQQQPHNYHKWR